MKNDKEIKEIFKQLYGTFIDKKFNNIPTEEIVKIALRTISQFAENNAIHIEYKIH